MKTTTALAVLLGLGTAAAFAQSPASSFPRGSSQQAWQNAGYAAVTAKCKKTPEPFAIGGGRAGNAAASTAAPPAPALPKSTASPGVIAADQQWKVVWAWEGNNADGPILEFLERVVTAIDDDPGIELLLLIDRSEEYYSGPSLLGEDFTGARLYRLRKEACERLAGGAEFPELTLQNDVELDSLRPAHSTSIGQVLLASLSAAELDDYIAHHELTRADGRPPISERMLRKILAQARADGYVTIADSLVAGTSGAAAPVVAAGRTVAGLAIIAPTVRFDAARNRIIPRVVAAARELGRAIGGAP